MRELADAFLRDVGRRPNSPEAGVAYRVNGVTDGSRRLCPGRRGVL